MLPVMDNHINIHLFPFSQSACQQKKHKNKSVHNQLNQTGVQYRKCCEQLAPSESQVRQNMFSPATRHQISSMLLNTNDKK